MESVSDAKYTGLIKRIGKWTMILGIANAVFYLLHDIIGGLNYPGYNWMEQAVSDLTAVDSPAREIAKIFTGLHGALLGAVLDLMRGFNFLLALVLDLADILALHAGLLLSRVLGIFPRCPA